jgi:hypothetical protein
MTRARDIANLVDANGDIVAGALDNVPAADVVNDTTPQLGGDLQSNGNDVVFADNDKAIFGAGNDLQIYHNGSDSYVDDTGTGALILRGNANVTIGKYTGETMGFFEADGAVSLYHDNSIKLATTSTGVDVTGNITVDAEGGSATVDVRQGLCKCWTDYDGDANTMRDSFNITSTTDNGPGDFTFAWSSNMSSANYSPSGSAGEGRDGGNGVKSMCATDSVFTTSQLRTGTRNDGSYIDADDHCLHVMGDLA